MARAARYSKLRYSVYSKFLINSGERVILGDKFPTTSVNVRGRLGVEYSLFFGCK